MTEQATDQTRDWHPAYVKFMLEVRAKKSIRQLSEDSGYGRDSLKKALRRPWPAAEAIYAKAIGVDAQTIWPTRYDEFGQPKKGNGQRGASQDHSTSTSKAGK